MYVHIWKFIGVFVNEAINSELLVPLVGDRRCHGNHFAPLSLGGTSLCQHQE